MRTFNQTILFSILLLFTSLLPCTAEGGTIGLLDENSKIGYPFELNCSGTGITCTKSGGRGIITVNGTASSSGDMLKAVYDSNDDGIVDVANTASVSTTASANDNDTSIATTAYVQTELTAYDSDTATFTNKTFDANGTGNSLSNVETADIASGSKSGSDTTLITGTAGSSGHCAEWNADGDLVTAGAACGTGSGGGGGSLTVKNAGSSINSAVGTIDVLSGSNLFFTDAGLGVVNLAVTLTHHTNIIYVGKHGNDSNDGLTPNDAKLTIDAANTVASSGDLIFIYPGTYAESEINLTAGVDVMGSGRGVTIVQNTSSGGSSIGTATGIFNVGGDHVFSHITINDTTDPDVTQFTNAININTASVNIVVNDVEIDGGYDGILVGGDANVTLKVFNSDIKADYDPFGLWGDNGNYEIHNTRMYSYATRTDVNARERCIGTRGAASSEPTLKVYSSSCYVDGSSADEDVAGIWIGTLSAASDGAFVSIYDSAITVVGTTGMNTTGVYIQSSNSTATMDLFNTSIEVSGGDSNFYADENAGAITFHNVTYNGTINNGTVTFSEDTTGRLNIDGTTCLEVSSDRIYHDTDCDSTKDAGEEFIDQAGGGGGSGSLSIQEADSNVVTNAGTIDFDGTDFNVTADGSGEGDITLGDNPTVDKITVSTSLLVVGSGNSSFNESVTIANSLIITGMAADSTSECVQVTSNGTLQKTGSACGSGGGATTSSGGVTYVTTTTDDFAVGSTTSSGADLFVDVGTGVVTINSSLVIQGMAASDQCVQVTSNGTLQATGSACGSGPGVTKLVTWKANEGYPCSASNFATLDTRNYHPVLDFDGATNEAICFDGVMPDDYSAGGVTVSIYSTSDGTTGDMDWDVAFEDTSAQDIDSDGFAAVNSTDGTSVNGTSGIQTEVTIAFTDGADMDSVSAGDPFRIKVTRDAASDTSTDDLQLLRVSIYQ